MAPRTQQQIDTLETALAELRERLDTLEARVASDSGELAPPARSLRRASARRASRRRAQARALQTDERAAVLAYLAAHPGSTAGELAKALDMERSIVSSRITQLVRLGEVAKLDRGYAAKP
ncbi:MAG TPA: MarR family transcriptional regulator [Solirubrobacteraceae bacterium]